MTKEEESNVQVLRVGYQMWNESKAGSVDYWMNLVADDVRWRTLGADVAGPEFAAGCGSKQEVERYFQKVGEQWEMLSYVAEEFIAQGDRVVMLGRCHWKHRQTNRVVESPKADVHRFRNGKIVDFMEFYDTAAVVAAATTNPATKSAS
jgi:ketosteroid isomerase-like protein